MKALTSIAAATSFAIPIAVSSPAEAGVDYCMTTNSGARVCIVGVYGPRSNRGMIWTLNGQIVNSRINCYNDDFGSTSISAVACWNYESIKAEPKDAPEVTEIPESVKGIMTEGGFISEDKAIDLEKVKNAMPPEMK